MMGADNTEADKDLSGQDNRENDEQPEGQSRQEPTANEQIEALNAALKDQQNKYLYLYADFENYKKRAIKERSDLLKFGSEGLVRELLTVKDNLERALAHSDSHQGLITGLKLVDQQLREALQRFGVSEVSALGEKFDPTHHEAVAQEQVSGAGNGGEPGTVLKEHQKGYTLHGRLLRPARVVVAVK